MSAPLTAAAVGAAAPGVFGKLPARADFLSRGLPPSFADPWHAWLVRGLAAARQELGRAIRAGLHGGAGLAVRGAFRHLRSGPRCRCRPAERRRCWAAVPADARSRFAVSRAAALPRGGAALVRGAGGSRAGRARARSGDRGVARALGGDGAALCPDANAASLQRTCPSRMARRSSPPSSPALARLGAERAVLFWCDGSPFVARQRAGGAGLPEGAWFARLLSDPAPAPALPPPPPLPPPVVEVAP